MRPLWWAGNHPELGQDPPGERAGGRRCLCTTRENCKCDEEQTSEREMGMGVSAKKKFKKKKTKQESL